MDARGRKQYRYHPDWRAQRDSAKFDRMVQFGEALPRLRRAIRRDLALPGLPQDKVLAVVVALLDSTLVRVGNVEYARDNNSFGLTTLRDRHVKFIRDGRAVLSFRGKGGIEHEVAINDRRLARIVRHCQAVPGQHLFQYVGYDGLRHPVDSDQVNGYIARAMGADFTAKDFRTWGATERAIALMSCTPLPEEPSDAKLASCIMQTVKIVAAELRNTPAVCRKSYINPAVFEAWREGRLHRRGAGLAQRALGAGERQWIEIPPTAAVREQAYRMLRVHPLRAADALQLAAALVAAQFEPRTLPFVSLDERLNQCAAREGFPIA